MSDQDSGVPSVDKEDSIEEDIDKGKDEQSSDRPNSSVSNDEKIRPLSQQSNISQERPNSGSSEKSLGNKDESSTLNDSKTEIKIPSRPTSSGSNRSRPKSGSSTSSRRRSRKSNSPPPNSHRVTFQVTIAQAIPTIIDEDSADLRASLHKKKRIVEAPRAQNYFHSEYFLLPDDAEPVKTDVVTFGMAAKVYPEKQEPKVIKTWIDGETTWVAWTHSHTIDVTHDMLLKLYRHNLELRIWDTKDKVSTRARFDRPKAFRLPQAKAGEDADAAGGIKGLVIKQAKNFEKMQPKRQYIDRALPSQTKLQLPRDDTEMTINLPQGKASKMSKSVKYERSDKKATREAMPAQLEKLLEDTSRQPSAPDLKSSLSKPVTPGVKVTPAEPPSGTPSGPIRTFSKLGHLAGVEGLLPEDEGPKKPKTPDKQSRTGSQQPGTANSKAKDSRRSSMSPTSARKESGRHTLRSQPYSVADSEATGTPGTAQTARKSAITDKASRPRRNKKAEAALRAQLEYEKKHGKCVIPIRMAEFFAGVKTVTRRLEDPVHGVDDVFITVNLDKPLMSEEQRMQLNPMIIKVHSATNMPNSPITQEELKLRCHPCYVQYKFFRQPTHKSVGREHDTSVYWDDIDVILTGTIEPSELREFLNGPLLEVEVHDRDRKLEETKLKPALFGEDLEDEKISNVGTVASRRTIHNPFHERDRPWDPYGVARFNLSDLLLGQRTLNLKSPILNGPIPDILGQKDKPEGKVMGVAGAVDGPTDTPIATGHYIQSQAMLKIKVELAYPITTPEQVAAKEPLDTTFECPFARIVFVFAYNNVKFLNKLQSLVTQINAVALELDTLPEHVIDAALSTYKLTMVQQKNRHLDIVTGFQVMDRTYHIFVLEGLRGHAISQIWKALPQPENEDVIVLYNSELAFGERLYGPLDVDLCRVKLHEPMETIVKQSLLYVRDMVPKPCFLALVKIQELMRSKTLRDCVRNDLFPSAEMVVSMSREFGVPLTSEDFEELQPEADQKLVNNDPSKNFIHQMSFPQTSRMWTPIDNENTDFMEYLSEREKTAPMKDFIKDNMAYTRSVSMMNKQKRELTMPPMIRADVKVAHNYSTQALNSTEKGKEEVREILSQWPDERFTYNPAFHHSMTVVPINVEAIKKQEEQESKDKYRTPNGWTYPGKKTMQEANKHPNKPDEARIDEIHGVWTENVLHANVLEPTLNRERYDWSNRQVDLDIWTKPRRSFGDEPITIHLAGDKLDKERRAAAHSADAAWRSKVIVDDPRVYLHRCNLQTEQRDTGYKSSNELDRLRQILKDDPQKYSLKKKPMVLKDIPPLNVVLNPSVDTTARRMGLSTEPAVPGEGIEKTKGFMPGPYRDNSWSLDRNYIASVDYEHKKFQQLKGKDFNVYHKERSPFAKRSIVPLYNAEHDNHLFWTNEEAYDFRNRHMTLPDIGAYKEYAKEMVDRQVTFANPVIEKKAVELE
ncbi:unnamed protein product [Owenia fusiformis]|uniref:Uncharacterized protein n=1 Tax=Owenia fusiformis TaxID=6347 RepID=A0A8J1XH59_OWEFU|nr:unnamed protein product [Owenia fusiformis]